jgi:O-antigen ligase
MMLTSVFTIFLFFGKKRFYISLIIVGVSIGIFVLLLNLPFFSTMKDRFLTMFSTLTNKSIEGTNTSDMSTIGRIQMFQNGVEMFFRKPLFGYGVNGFFVSSSYGGSWSHNHFSETLCSFGLLGTILYHIPFYYSIKGFFDKNRSKNSNISLILICFFVMMMFSVALVSQKIFAYTIGLACAELNPATRFEKKVSLNHD